ncbi:MAG: hypothetical protein HYX68_11780 [Planctomycetes bacterium]|nr:hypothetical protein [Planctomycetota bacterium]
MYNILLLLLTILIVVGSLGAETAVEPSGKKHRGKLALEKTTWVFRTETAKTIALDNLAYVRFDRQPTPTPKAPLRWLLRLPGGQHVTGNLRRVDETKVAFVTSWGQTVTVARARAVGIEQADDSLIVATDDFESSLMGWQIQGKPTLQHDLPFFGKSSLRLDASKQTATRIWKPGVRTGVVRLFVRTMESPAKSPRAIEILTDPKRAAPPTLKIAAGAYECVNLKKPYGRLKTTQAWRAFSAEAGNGRLRIFVDDTCLGETTFTPEEAIVGIRIIAGDARLWIDELSATRRVARLHWPRAVKDQDMLWLENGEQFFGPLASANSEYATLAAKFGNRKVSWARMRGIQFAQKKQTAISGEWDITFRPGPGFPVDRVRATLVRWNGDSLMISHEIFGELALGRDRLDTIRPAAK